MRLQVNTRARRHVDSPWDSLGTLKDLGFRALRSMAMLKITKASSGCGLGLVLLRLVVFRVQSLRLPGPKQFE